ncbi:unnamed protein product [Colias eurytheme]|nr:unnamed protein product [Colias eurytheme]
MLYKAFVFVLLFNFLNAKESGLPDILPRILYGDEVRIEDHPYFAGLVDCGAAIISDRYLLTAAHCVEDSENKENANIVFVGGETEQNSQIVHYDDVIIHKDYQIILSVPLNDIAILKLSKPLKFSKKVQPLKLPRQMNTNSNLTFVGRGLGEDGKATKELLKMDVKRLTTQECISHIPPQYHFFVYAFKDELEEMSICAKRTNSLPGVCFGDSGSPLTDGNVLVGLASFIGNTCDSARLGFYVNVAYYADWVRHVTGLQ